MSYFKEFDFVCFFVGLFEFYYISTFVDYLMPNPFSYKNNLELVRSLNLKTVLFQAIQFSIGTQFSSVWPIDKTLCGATTPSDSGPGSDGNKGVFRIPQSSSITRTSPSDCLVSYSGHSWGSLTPLQRCSWCILQPQPTEQKEFDRYIDIVLILHMFCAKILFLFKFIVRE